MNADLLRRNMYKSKRLLPPSSYGAVGLSMRTGKKDRLEEAGFEGASGKNTFTPLSKDI